MKLTNQQILALTDAIALLDGQHVTQVVEGKAVSVFRSYRLAHTARWQLARAQGRLQSALADFNRAKDALINHHSGGAGGLGPANPNFKQFSAEFEQLKRQPVELSIEPVALNDLKLEENERAGSELPIAILNALSPLIENPVLG